MAKLSAYGHVPILRAKKRADDTEAHERWVYITWTANGQGRLRRLVRSAFRWRAGDRLDHGSWSLTHRTKPDVRKTRAEVVMFANRKATILREKGWTVTDVAS